MCPESGDFGLLLVGGLVIHGVASRPDVLVKVFAPARIGASVAAADVRGTHRGRPAPLGQPVGGFARREVYL